MTQEYWKPVVGYEGLYEVSDQGRVKSIPRPSTKGGLLKQGARGRYRIVSLWKNNRATSKAVHQLVAHAFLGPQPKGVYVLHGAAGSSVDALVNLRYGTQKENMADKYRDGTEQTGTRNNANKLTEAQVLEIRAIGSSMKQRDIAAAYGVSQRTVNVILRRLGWTHLD